MRNQKGRTMVDVEPAQRPSTFHRSKFGAFLHSDPSSLSTLNHEYDNHQEESFSKRLSHSTAMSPNSYLEGSPMSTSSNTLPFFMSPWNQTTSPYNTSPWNITPASTFDVNFPRNGLVGSLVREEGHIYSLAVFGDLLYTGTDSKNIRIWKNLKEFTGFKSNSGLVKSIVISGQKIFTGHQDGKIRVWKVSTKNPRNIKRIGSLPTFKDHVKSSMNPKSYVEVKQRKNVLRIKHFDAVSSMSLNKEEGLLYSGSWDKTLKVWRISDSKCLESINAHGDAVNSVVAGFERFVFTGSADGMVKMWRRESAPNGKTKHELDKVLLKQENAVTALVVNHYSKVVYCGSSDGLVNLWASDEKNCLRLGGVLRGHKQAVLCLATEGNLMLSGSADKNLCVWKREESGEHMCLSVLTGHTGPVKCIAIEEEQVEEEEKKRWYAENTNWKGNQRWIVYTGSLDKSVKVWRVWENAPELELMRGGLASDALGPDDLNLPPAAADGGRLSFSNIRGQ